MDIALARQFASFVGALLILIAYAGHQLRWIDARSAGSNILNAIGSAILATLLAILSRSGSWCWKRTVISVYPLLRPRPE